MLGVVGVAGDEVHKALGQQPLGRRLGVAPEGFERQPCELGELGEQPGGDPLLDRKSVV